MKPPVPADLLLPPDALVLPELDVTRPQMYGNDVIVAESRLDAPGTMDALERLLQGDPSRHVIVVSDRDVGLAAAFEDVYLRKEKEASPRSDLSHGGWHDLPRKPRGRWKATRCKGR